MRVLQRWISIGLLTSLFSFGLWQDGHSHWEKLVSGTTEQLQGVFFTSPDTGWVVGLNGTILHTTDGGATWTSQVSGTNSSLQSVVFTNSSTGYITGSGGTLLKTTDTGATWTPLVTNVQHPLFGIDFVTDQLGFVVGGTGTVLKTTDAGQTWTLIPSGTTRRLNDVDFIDATTGYVVGDSNFVMKSINGGSGWIFQNSGTTNHHLRSVQTVNATTAFASMVSTTFSSNSGGILRTTNGTSWVELANRPTANPRIIQPNMHAMSFPTDSIGFAVGGNGRIIKTTNMGSNWDTQKNEDISHLFAVHFPDVTAGYAVGQGGTIFKYIPIEIEMTSFKTAFNWQAGRLSAISFTSLGIDNVDLHYTKDAGETWIDIATNVSAASGRYFWNVPYDPTTTARVRIRDSANPHIFDESMANLTISVLELTEPAGLKRLQVGKTVQISWDHANVARVQLQYSINGGTTWTAISGAEDISSTFKPFNWVVPNTPSESVGIRIVNRNHLNMYDVADANLSIYAYSLALTSPNTNVTWDAGSARTIQWTSEGIDRVRLEFSADDGNSWGLIQDSIPATPASYAWTVPNIPTSTGRIRVSDVDSLDFFDDSNSTFTITALALTSPSGGEFFEIGNTVPITWESSGISTIQLQLSTDSGMSWSGIAGSLPAASGSYEWTVPNVPTRSARIRIRNAANLNQIDTTDADFMIYQMDVNFPNGGQSWTGGEPYTISWRAEPIDSIRVEFTKDGGENWETIFDSIPSVPLSREWIVPNEPTNQAKIRISSIDYPELKDESNSVFSIRRYAALYRDTVIAEHPSYINVMFHALDQNGVGVTNLQESEFKVEENNQVISESESFKQVGKADQLEYTMKTVLILDNSFSLSLEDLATIKQAAIRFIENKLPDQWITVYEFSENVVMKQDFTTDVDELRTAINGIQRGFPSTNLYGAVLAGLERWTDSYSLTAVEQGSLVIFTDGDDTQGSSTLQQVMNARGNKRVITLGLGNDINSSVLQSIGNEGFYAASNASQLNAVFLEVQQNLIQFTESFYWLNYVSPKRGNNNHTLRVSLYENVNTSGTASFTAPFSSNGFSSIFFGILINPEPMNLMGVDTIRVGVTGPTMVTIRVPFSFEPPDYTLQIPSGDSLSIQPFEPENDSYLVQGYGSIGDTLSVTISEERFGFSRQFTVILDDDAVGIEDDGVSPESFALDQNFPNPFNPSTVIRYQKSVSGHTRLTVYDVLGREVAVLVDGIMPAGAHQVTFDASSLASGMYLYRLTAGGQVITRRMMLVK